MTVRAATADGDAQVCAAIYAPYVTDTAVTFESEPPTGTEMADRIAAAARRHAWLVLEDGGRVIGYAYAGPHKLRPAYRWACEVSVYLERGRRRTGGGRLLYEALLARLAERGFRTAVAGCHFGSRRATRLRGSAPPLEIPPDFRLAYEMVLTDAARAGYRLDPEPTLHLRPGTNSQAVHGPNRGTTSPRIEMGADLVTRSPQLWLWPLRHEVAHIIRRHSGTDHSTTPATIVNFALIAVAAAAGFTGLAVGGMGSPAASIGMWVAGLIIALGFAVAFAAIRREEAGTDRTVVTVFGTPMTRPDVAFLSEIEGQARVPLLFRSHPRPGRRYVDTIAAAEDLAGPADNPSS